MCFSPQRRAILAHQMFEKCSESEVLCRATAVCDFSTSELQKVLRTWRALYIFTQNLLFATAACNFRHRNFKQCSETDVFCTFSLENLLFATAACNVWFLLGPHDSAPAALTGLLFDCPNTRIIKKTQHFATSLTFGADVSSLFWLSR